MSLDSQTVIFTSLYVMTLDLTLKPPQPLRTALDRKRFLIADKQTELYSMCHGDFP